MGTNLDFSGGNLSRGDLRGGVHLLEALIGRRPDIAAGLAQIDQTGTLRALGDSYTSCANLSPTALATMLKRGEVPRGLVMPRPDSGTCICPNRYATTQQPDFSGSSAMERFLFNNPFERQQLEMAIGGRIVKSGDGSLTVQPFTAGAFPSGGTENNAAYAAQALLGSLARGAGPNGLNNMSPQVATAFQGMILNAMAQVLVQRALGNTQNGQPQGQTFQSMRANGQNPFVDWTEDSPNVARRRAMRGGPAGAAGGAAAAMASVFAGGGNNAFVGGGADADFSSAMNPGASADFASAMNPASMYGNGNYGLGATGDDIGAVLNDGGLTVEDKITLMIMMIMKQMDKQIEQQANYINSLQQQQNGGGKGGKGGGGGAPSIDVETMKLKRLIDKRSQMFDMLRQIIDKYNQTAKGIIDSMGR